MLVLLALFVARVLGQILAATVRPRWLPPMARWYSGVMPYRYLLPSQLLIIALMIAMIVGVDRGSGVLGDRHSGVGAFAIGASLVYAGGMMWRAVRRALQPPARRGVVIPIVFHFVLAAFLFVFGRWHLSTAPIP
jgi:hypothetical protein